MKSSSSMAQRSKKIATGLVLALGCTLGVAPAITDVMSSSAADADASQLNPLMVGAGAADMTGEVAEVGFMGYGSLEQKGEGLHMRQYARAFVIENPHTAQRNLIIVLDALSAYDSVRQELLRRLTAEYGAVYGESNVMVTATHTHATPGGVTKHSLYNVTTAGWHPDTFNATIDGAMDAVHQAHADMAPGNLTVSISELEAGVNRSLEAFSLNPESLQSKLNQGVDTTNTTFRLERNGVTEALINWYAIHPTNLMNTNKLVSGDNKGYAQYLLETVDHGVDWHMGKGGGFVAAFANSDTGDVSPNTFLQPGQGPTGDHFTNMKIQGQRQADAVRAQLTQEGESAGTDIDSRITYVDFEQQVVSRLYTGTGKIERTCDASLGQSFAAGAVEDGPGPSIFGEGLGANAFFAGVNRAVYNISPRLAACQAPKENLLAVSVGNTVQTHLPVQIMQFGDYYLLGLPGEWTGAAGVTIKQDAAELFGVPEEKIILQGYTNAYSHYVTTPEEYDSQQYEGGATLFGRYTLPAFRQTVQNVGAALKHKVEMPLGDKPSEPHAPVSGQGKVLYDVSGFRRFGDVLSQPRNVRPGETVSAVFQGAHPNNSVGRSTSFLEIQKYDGQQWQYVTNDNDPNTKFIWKRYLAAQSKITLEWQIPTEAEAGTYRLVYRGHAKTYGTIKEITGVSQLFTVSW
ncbi:neutral/alkaline non-lysosomal ceramidase N-terminal domain-containing protein [Rothia sp. ZJ932]|uniref:neutral/alkaline non-lysosomal ceramidase N-terminal domain-containing protein n=1 Tax=Rothia sp. ZJ932 TaxID=2810516 RepID=UPI001967F2D8|nr:neutral/alkaline non-lysosomal ceramidase N-terminal domain-containing protein [Rothia sp. ZJ932]QRZ62070.1 neutral/alkaline non-lysosomal ceramidase N-terminal domain-containing protein [Rothia sp. ZJ932]